MSKTKTFIVFEGIEGSGKSTHAFFLVKKLKSLKIPCIYLREPGGSKEAESIRNFLFKKENNKFDALTDALLYLAARNENFLKKIKPFYKKKIIICDRYIDSTMAYQHYGLGVKKDIIDFVNKKITGTIKPDYTFLMHLDVDKSILRILNRKKITIIILLMIIFFSDNIKADYKDLAYSFKFNNLDGSELNLNEFRNKIIIVINVASQCGFTRQYEDMQNVWDKFKDRNVIMLGVPSNDFGNQEPGTNEEIKNFCESKFGITFPMTEKVSVKGKNSHPFYQWAKENHGKSAIPRWNFHKIIINKSGRVEDTFSSIIKSSSKKFIAALEKAINKK